MKTTKSQLGAGVTTSVLERHGYQIMQKILLSCMMKKHLQSKPIPIMETLERLDAAETQFAIQFHGIRRGNAPDRWHQEWICEAFMAVYSEE